MKKLRFILLCFLLTSCGMRRESQKVAETKAESAEIQMQSVEMQKLISELSTLRAESHFELSSNALQLEALSSDKPAIFVEMQGGDTIRKIVVQNGKLNQENVKKDSTAHFELKNLRQELEQEKEQNAVLEQENQKQQEQIKYLERDNSKLYSGLKYASFLVALALIAGLIWYFSRFFR
ncbi:hypothetical protein ACT4RS_07405 [Ornithobacterium rhinotracheale]|uniref:hypothetical protein n=1 Tax=Ornithobacterium rhinotracheale TaxID=28251 RepID=UPI00403521EC